MKNLDFFKHSLQKFLKFASFAHYFIIGIEFYSGFLLLFSLFSLVDKKKHFL